MLYTHVDPHEQCGRVDLVELVEVAVDDSVVRETVLLPGGDHDSLRHLLTRRCLIVGLVCG